MGDTYQKAAGSAGSKGTHFQIDLLSLFLLNALWQNIRGWRLSTENILAGKFDDVVLELSDGSAILLQAKHKESKKITLDQLLSINPKNEDFSLPKYFCSYLDVRTRFRVKLVIVCTNTQADPKILKYLDQNSVGRDSMLHCEDDASFFTFGDGIVADLITKAKDYHENNLKGKGVDESLITELNAKEFLKHLQFYSDYPSGSDLERAIEKSLSSAKFLGYLLHGISCRDLHQKVKDWFEHPKGEYLTESRSKAMFCEIRSEKYRECLENHKVFFKNIDYKIANSKKRIFHVVAEGGHLLHLLKVYRDLQHSRTQILYACSDYGMDVQIQTIKAFEQPHYTLLIIVSPQYSEYPAVGEICVTLKDILETRDYKKAIFVADRDDMLTHRTKTTSNDYDVFDEPLTLADLSEDTQSMLLRKKSVIFQGEHVSVGDLLPEQMTDDQKKSVRSKILEKLLLGEEFTVGIRLTCLEGRSSNYYINRQIKSTEKTEVISDDDVWKVEDKMILISDSAGMGKTTVLKKLAVSIKKNDPRLWVVRMELNLCVNVLRDSLSNNRSVHIWELLSCINPTGLTDELEKFIFSLEAKVVLMLDGVDEISPDYTTLILDLLRRCQRAKNLKKVFVTTRPHMERQLQAHLDVMPFKLVPFTEQNQIDFLTRYFAYNLKCEGESVDKCERYASILKRSVSSWINEWHNRVKLVGSPLHARILAEVFLENKGIEEWEGCKEYLEADEEKPKLPVKMNLARLYDMFVERKRDIFMSKGNPSGNAAANQALMEQFEECLTYHRSLALHTFLGELGGRMFSCYKRDIAHAEETKVLRMGIVQKVYNQLVFVHLTFAEYFTAESMLMELLLRNQDYVFQRFLVNRVFVKSEYQMIRQYLDNFLYERLTSLSPDVFNTYMSRANDANSSFLIHRLAEEGNYGIIRLVLKSIRGKQVSPTNYARFFRKKNWNNLNILRYRGGIDAKENGWTPLHRAVLDGRLDTVKCLVELGADVNCKNEVSSEVSRVIRRTRLDNDWNTDRFAFRYQGIHTYDIRNMIKTDGSYTALHMAVVRERLDIVEFLVKCGADSNIADDRGNTAAHFAAMCDSCEIFRFLQEHGANIYSVDKFGKTELHCAAELGKIEVVASILERHGADINTADNEGNTAVHYAATSGNFHVLEHLVKYDANIYRSNGLGKTAFHFAAEVGGLLIMDFLLKQGSDINNADVEGDTALHFAFSNCWQITNRRNIVEFLVKHGGDINIANGRGRTVLHLAVSENTYNRVKYLVEQGANVHIADKDGDTALHLAVQKRNMMIVRLLVKHHADINVANKMGHTALDYARMDARDSDIARLLVEHGGHVNSEARGFIWTWWMALRNRVT